MATNLDLELNRQDASNVAQEGLRLLLELIDRQPRRVVMRFRVRILFARPSFAIRLHHFRPFLVWLMERPVEYVPAESVEAPE